MAGAQHNPTRRALLGAALGVPLLSEAGDRGTPCRPLHHTHRGHAEARTAAGSSPGSLGIPRSGAELWASALADFQEAQAQVAAIEAPTAGASAAEEEAWLPAHDAACGAMEAALARAMLVPAPDVAALAVKLELYFAHALEPGSFEEESGAALLADAERLLR
jgi:hypothetical protein